MRMLAAKSPGAANGSKSSGRKGGKDTPAPAPKAPEKGAGWREGDRSARHGVQATACADLDQRGLGAASLDRRRVPAAISGDAPRSVRRRGRYGVSRRRGTAAHASRENRRRSSGGSHRI